MFLLHTSDTNQQLSVWGSLCENHVTRAKNVVSRLILLEKERSKAKNPSVYHRYLIIRIEDTGRPRREDMREYLHDFRHVLTSHVRSLLQPPPALNRPFFSERPIADFDQRNVSAAAFKVP